MDKTPSQVAPKAGNTGSALMAPDMNDAGSTTMAPDSEERASTSWVENSLDPEPGNDLYTIIPKEGYSLPQTVDFIKRTFGARALLHWTDVQEHPKHCTVEASPDEVAKLQAHAGIDEIYKLGLPQASADAATLVRRQAPEDEQYLIFPVSRQAAQDEQYGIFPVNEEDHQQNNATDKALKGMLGKRVQEPLIHPRNGQVDFWTATLNAGEVEKVKGIPGVGAVMVDLELELD